jgi:uncharacterized protein
MAGKKSAVIRSVPSLVLLVFALAGCVQDAFYHPDRVLYDTPRSAGFAFEPVSFASADGTRLTGWFIPAVGVASPRDAKATVIHFHGNAQNMSAHWTFVRWLPPAGYNVFVFDYRGYGASEGRPDPRGLFDDSRAALDYVRSRADVDPARLVVFGQSLGGTNAIDAVASGDRRGVRAVVIEATFASYSAIANEKIASAGSLVSDDYSAERFVARIAPIPILFIHGTEDPVIPYSHSERLFALAGEPKALWTVPGGGHTEAFGDRFGERYRSLLLHYLADEIGL